MPAATPANSAHSRPEVGDDQRTERDAGARGPVALAHERHQALAGDDAHARRQLVEDDQRDGGEREDPQQLVAVVGAEDRVGRDARRVVVGEAGEHPGPTTSSSAASEARRSGRRRRRRWTRRRCRWRPAGARPGEGIGWPEEWAPVTARQTNRSAYP